MDLLRAYDEQLRGDGEVQDATDVVHIGPVTAVVFPRGTGFATYHTLAGVDDISALIADVISHFEHLGVAEFEWKTRGHDKPSNLLQLLMQAGFEPEPVETVMVGEASLVANAPDLDEPLTLRRVTDEADVVRALEMTAKVFGRPANSMLALSDSLRQRADELSLWVVEDAGEPVGAGRIDIVPNSDFAGVWGGAVVPEYRGRGIYRALVAARARWAMDRGAMLIHSDCSDMSRPILAKSGLTAVTTTTPYVWRAERMRFR